MVRPTGIGRPDGNSLGGAKWPKTYSFDKSQTTMNLPEGEQFGFLAQDLEEVFPNLVHKQKHIENPTEKKEDIITKEYNSVD